MKRKRRSQSEENAQKARKIQGSSHEHPTVLLLRQYYPKVLSLRHYLASKASKSSKKLQKRLLSYDVDCGASHTSPCVSSLAHLLDNTFVGSFERALKSDDEDIDRDISVFTQQLSESTSTVTPTQGALKQSEIVDFTIWVLFRRHKGPYNPSHLLAQGYHRFPSGPDAATLDTVPGVPGVFSRCSNPHVQTLKGEPWSALPSVVGKQAERIISDMFLECGIFRVVENSSNSIQLSGLPMHELKLRRSTDLCQPDLISKKTEQAPIGVSRAVSYNSRALSDVRLLRHKMLYAKPVLGGHGNICFGLSHVHVLNQQRETDSRQQTVHVMKYIFPRQFGLHNVFTSDVHRKDTAQQFKDYTSRDREIAEDEYRRRSRRAAGPEKTDQDAPLPKRLRGEVEDLVSRLRKRHNRCSYAAMLEHYCPRTSDSGNTLGGSFSQASNVAHVSAFCRAIITKVVPGDFWGDCEMRQHNRKIIMWNVDKFVRLRRYETLSLHDIVQDVGMRGTKWLGMRHEDGSAKMSRTDFSKRKEIMAELLYYIFDSYLIPLIRGHFHVTESGSGRNRLYYFRHDVWKAMSEPALASLIDTMLEPHQGKEAKRNMSRQSLGFSHVRLLPKEQGMRPIINLRRRAQKTKNGQIILGKSINSVLSSTFSVLNYEKTTNPSALASAMFSVEDIYPRLQAFRQTLHKKGLAGKPLYFAKVDVKACFDSIPQKHLMELARSILHADAYHVAKYARGKLLGVHSKETPGFGARPSWKFSTTATAVDKTFDFAGEVTADSADGRARTAYVGGVLQKTESRRAILELLEEHIESNLLKIGNKFYRQKQGIPQGSIVSSLLCSYFYAALERNVLGFVNDGQSVLLRLIDDFLVISTELQVAEHFMRIMHQGVPEFGVEVKFEKSRANFDVVIDGQVVPRLPSHTMFPYCGNAIDTRTLDLSKDKERSNKRNVPDSISVEFSRLPGQTFYRKTLNALKLHMQAMLLSTTYNSITTVLSNLHHSFTEVAQKTYHYVRSLSSAKQPTSALIIKTVDDLIKLACVLMKRRKRTSKDIVPYACSVSNQETRWFACIAFHAVFVQRQTRHRTLLAWLEGQMKLPGMRAQWPTLAQSAQ